MKRRNYKKRRKNPMGSPIESGEIFNVEAITRTAGTLAVSMALNDASLTEKMLIAALIP